MNLKHFGIMLDCSRNGVLTVESVKRFINLMQKMGYNTLMLYTEDTFEVDNQPYFGYLRGRYSKDELREIDDYAAEHGIELIPCIQTLAHLNSIVRWKEYQPFTDCDDILLAEDERTYQLIEDIFTTLGECFTSRVVNIGMDEAHMVGLGKYLDKHGYCDRVQVLMKHLARVCEIAERHGFKPLMWSDMFFKLAAGGQYYAENACFDQKVVDSVPPELGLIYWDYYSQDREHYDNMISAHQQFHNDIWFAGGIWTWNGFAPRNGFSMKTIDAAIPSLLAHGVENVIFTMWGDDGSECSPFAALPAMYYASCAASGVTDADKIKSGFFELCGIPFDDYMQLDLPGNTDKPDSTQNPEKYMTYNDCFSGVFDCTVKGGADFVPHYAECAAHLKKYADNTEYGYLFDSAEKLCGFLQIKYTLGLRTRDAYRAGDREKLREIADDYSRAIFRLGEFYTAFEKRWFSDNKPHGFDVQDIRLGGLEKRMKHCRSRIIDYCDGVSGNIAELDEDILPEWKPGTMSYNKWIHNATVNVISHSVV